MRAALSLIILCFLIPCIVTAQEEIIPSVNIGDPSPPLQIREWLKGKPIRHFEKGKIYVMEFWATWCKPCKAAMPRLSTLARKYRDSVTIVGIDVYESLKTSLGMIKNFVDSMGSSMDYLVAAEDSNFMVEGWLSATDEKGNGIPRTFVVDRNGRLAWIGHPSALEMVLPDIIENRWDIQQALANRNLERHLKYLDKEASARSRASRSSRRSPR